MLCDIHLLQALVGACCCGPRFGGTDHGDQGHRLTQVCRAPPPCPARDALLHPPYRHLGAHPFCTHPSHSIVPSLFRCDCTASNTTFVDVPINTPPADASARTFYVLMAHTSVSSALTEARLSRMERELGAENALLLLDDTKAPHPNGVRLASSTWLPEHRDIYVNQAECKAASQYHTDLYGTVHTALAMFDTYLAGVDYQFIWVFEYDAICYGDWRKCLAPAASLPTDFMGFPYVGREDSTIIWDWVHWSV